MNSTNDKPIRYLSVADLCNINHTVTLGHSAVRDMQLLQSAANRPKLVLFGEAQFPSLFDKAGALMHSLAYHHLFFDGNKRTAALATTVFLEQNGYRLEPDSQIAYHYILEIAQGKREIAEIAGWLSEYSHALSE